MNIISTFQTKNLEFRHYIQTLYRQFVVGLWSFPLRLNETTTSLMKMHAIADVAPV